MENARFIIVFILLAACVVFSECTEDALPEDATECTMGPDCFPNGMPDDLGPSDISYYCCLEKNMTRHSTGDASNCSCQPDFTLDSKIQNWADNSMDLGRMCSSGEDCEGSRSSSSTNYRFTTCCWKEWINNLHVHPSSTIFDGDKEEYIGCRCVNHFIPTPDPAAYIVPPVLSFNSSGEACLYDKACEDKPFISCQSADVTFCCYGSRGIVTANEGQVTHCTCTNQLFLEHCQPNPVSIAMTTMPCQTDCAGRAESDKCTDSSNGERCCSNNMVVVASKMAGNFTSCTCQAQTEKNCDTSLSSVACLSSRLCDLLLFLVAILSLPLFALH